MRRTVPLTTGEVYHIYNRGAHKMAVFQRRADYERFMLLLFVCNGLRPVDLRSLLSKQRDSGNKGPSFVFVSELWERADPVVDVLGYALMPNHFHLIVRQNVDNGVSVFMRKVMTAYSMYFNTVYSHSGVIFQGRFKSSHIRSEEYYRYIFAYVHLNPVELIEANWKEGGINDPHNVRLFLCSYPHSSFYDYSVGIRPERRILAYDNAPDFLKTQDDLESLLSEYTKDGPLEKGTLGV